MIRTPILLALVGALLFAAGCDLQEDDSDAVLFDGTWRLVEAGSLETDFTALVLARYDDVVITFVEEEDQFTMLLDVSGSPDDELINGTFGVDSDDREIDLSSAAFTGTFDFDYNFVNADEVVLSSDDDEPVLETFFGIDLDVEDIILILERT